MRVASGRGVRQRAGERAGAGGKPLQTQSANRARNYATKFYHDVPAVAARSTAATAVDMNAAAASCRAAGSAAIETDISARIRTGSRARAAIKFAIATVAARRAACPGLKFYAAARSGRAASASLEVKAAAER